MRTQIQHSTRVAVLSLTTGFMLLLASAASVGGQSLQGAGGGLQPQAGQTQDSVNTQSRTGTVQNSNGGSVLNQTSGQPLGVVSGPNQAQPDAVVAPSDSLKTEITSQDNSGTLLRVAALLFAVSLLGAYFLRRKGGRNAKLQPLNESSSASTAQPVVRPEPIKTPKKRKQNKKTNKAGKKKKR